MSEPEMIEYLNGTKEWWVGDKLHREDGPAWVGSDGTKAWWVGGKQHREDGPAVEWANGDYIWYLNGNIYTFDEFLEKTPISREEKIVLKLTYMTEFA